MKFTQQHTALVAALVLAFGFGAAVKADSDSDLGRSEVGELGFPTRINPNDNFEEYEGKFDVESDDYWASLAMCGAYGFALALLWVFFTLVYVLVRMCCCMCGRGFCPKPRVFKPKGSHLCLKFGSFILCAVVIVGALCVFAGGGQLVTKLDDTMTDLIDAAGDMVDDIDTINAALTEALNLDSLSADQTDALEDTIDALDSGIDEIYDQVKDNEDNIRSNLENLSLGCLVLAAVFAGVAFLGLLLSYCGWNTLLVLMLLLLWVCTTLAWIFSGVTFFTYIFAGDLCGAIEDYLDDPASSSLDSLIPCMEEQTMIEALDSSHSAIVSITDAVNQGLYDSNEAFIYDDDMVYICPHYTTVTAETLCEVTADDEWPYDLEEEAVASWEGYASLACDILCEGDEDSDCVAAEEEVYPVQPECPFEDDDGVVYENDLGNFEEDYLEYKCESNNEQNCAIDGLIAKDTFDTYVYEAEVGQDVIDVMYLVDEFVTCVPVTDVLETIDGDHCDELITASQTLFGGFLLVAIGFTFLFPLFIISYQNHAAEVLSASQAKEVEMQYADTTYGVASAPPAV